MGVLSDIGLDDEKMAELAQKLMADMKWLHDNYDSITEKYSNKFVAVEDGKIIDSDVEMDILIKKLEKGNKNPDTLLIELVNPKDFILII